MGKLIDLFLGTYTEIDKEFNETYVKVSESMKELLARVDSINSIVGQLRERLARQANRIKGLEKLLVLDDSIYLDPTTLLFNSKYYKEVLKPNLSLDFKALKVTMRHNGPEFIILKQQLAKALKLFAARYHDEIIVWDEYTFIILYDDKKYVSKKIQKRLIDTLDDIITKKDFLNIGITSMYQIDKEV